MDYVICKFFQSIEKTTAATVLMSTFFALKFFVVIVLKFNVYTFIIICVVVSF